MLFIFWLYIGVISFTNIASVSKNAPVKIPKIIISTYNIFNSLINFYLFLCMCKYVLNYDIGMNTKNSKELNTLVYYHYLTKYLDFFDTIIMISHHKWNQISFLQLFHHSSIGVIWIWVYKSIPYNTPATYAFGACINSFVHFLMYFHYYVTSIGFINPLKKYLTNIQIGQFYIVLIHALYVGVTIPSLYIFSIVQSTYMVMMIMLFNIYINTKPVVVNKKKTPDKLQKLHINIRGKTYDVSQFASKHPGGNIIKKFDIDTIDDATDVFNNFHKNSQDARKFLSTMPVVKTNDTYVKSDFQMMLKKWDSRGLYKENRIHFIIWASVVTFMTLFSYFLLKHGFIYTAGILAGIFWAQGGFVQHHAAHLGFTGNPRIDFSVQSFMFALLQPASPRWWRNRHNKHHAMPNSVNNDGDLRTTPFFAWDDKLIKRVPKVLLLVQPFIFFVLLLLYIPILLYSKTSFILRNKHWDELCLNILHYVILFNYIDNNIILFHMIGWSVQGIYLGCMFGINHYTLPRIEPDDNLDWVQWQMVTTCNWGSDSTIASYVSGFLNLQIEHHIATRMPPHNYVKIRPDIKKYANKHSIIYNEYTFIEAFCNMIYGLHSAGVNEYYRRP